MPSTNYLVAFASSVRVVTRPVLFDHVLCHRRIHSAASYLLSLSLSLSLFPRVSLGIHLPSFFFFFSSSLCEDEKETGLRTWNRSRLSRPHLYACVIMYGRTRVPRRMTAFQIKKDKDRRKSIIYTIPWPGIKHCKTLSRNCQE
ncbi:hypothetical protein K504DRAFT_81108 [Pleomassaria siparia CBS 279.74]|uniref:Uncharacterized protein n=1 Tax=Pleomassaria siparia CBS 279.74 TaxID=1314801 RepID=A0A6G1K1V2_9PLEO|nr:hypothetical protein K504DRAFT_81108 [Pleomassaria siparia CBS 279.74]